MRETLRDPQDAACTRLPRSVFGDLSPVDSPRSADSLLSADSVFSETFIAPAENEPEAPATPEKKTRFANRFGAMWDNLAPNPASAHEAGHTTACPPCVDETVTDQKLNALRKMVGRERTEIRKTCSSKRYSNFASERGAAFAHGYLASRETNTAHCCLGLDLHAKFEQMQEALVRLHGRAATDLFKADLHESSGSLHLAIELPFLGYVH
jgi:hypothetical protein